MTMASLIENPTTPDTLLRNDAAAVTLAPGSALDGHAGGILLVMEGSVTVRTGDTRERVTPGIVTVLPAATPHQVRNDSTSAARLITLSLGRDDAGRNEPARLATATLR